jgi:hypothetical protein
MGANSFSCRWLRTADIATSLESQPNTNSFPLIAKNSLLRKIQPYQGSVVLPLGSSGEETEIAFTLSGSIFIPSADNECPKKFNF